MKKDYEITAVGRIIHFFPAVSAEAAEEEFIRDLPHDFTLDSIEVIEL